MERHLERSRARLNSLLAGLLVATLAGCGTTRAGGLPAPSDCSTSPRFLPAPCAQPPQRPPPGYLFPGRNPDSKMPWELYLGHAAHRIISYKYGLDHPDNKIFYNTETLQNILEEIRMENPAHLLPGEGHLRPDITDTTALRLYEVKPWNDEGLKEGRKQARQYLTILNRGVPPHRQFSGGMGFQGEMLIRFTNGNHIWRLEWCTPEPSIVQYHWTRSKERFDSEAMAYQAAEWQPRAPHHPQQRPWRGD
jgi:hypothetical protein